MEALKQKLEQQRRHLADLEPRLQLLRAENTRLRTENAYLTGQSTASTLSAALPIPAAPTYIDRGTQTVFAPESRQARVQAVAEYWPKMDIRNSDTNFTGHTCFACKRDNTQCNGKGPCNHCIATNELICNYIPCVDGRHCTNEECTDLHPGQDNPWTSDPGWPSMFGDGSLDAYKAAMFELFTKSQRVQQDWASFRHRMKHGNTVERPIVLE